MSITNESTDKNTYKIKCVIETNKIMIKYDKETEKKE